MTKRPLSRLAALQQRVLDFIEERTADSRALGPAWRRLRSLTQFVYLTVLGFNANRCPLRAAALCYTTLLALVPLLAVALVLAKGFVRDSVANAAPQLLDSLVAWLAPQLEVLPTSGTNAAVVAGQVTVSTAARREVVDQIQLFLGNIDTGTLGVLGTAALILVAIRLLMTVEQTFNDIWGVGEGRSIWRKVVYYWAAVSLGPILLGTAVAMTGRAEFQRAVVLLPGDRFLMAVVPYLALWVGFGLLYGLMPNTSVGWRAAAIGGIVAGTLWQLNSLLNTMYFSRVVTYSKIYGGLGVVPVLLLGLYLSWVIVLFGAQVSFAAQNFRSFIQQRATERVDQHGRELLACRLVLEASRQFLHGAPPPRPAELADRLRAPLQLVNRLIPRLTDGGVLSLTTGAEGGLTPARPPETITVADVLHVVRTADGKCGDAPARAGDPLQALLADLHHVVHAAPANANFRDLAAS
jgi:membrane protein